MYGINCFDIYIRYIILQKRYIYVNNRIAGLLSYAVAKSIKEAGRNITPVSMVQMGFPNHYTGGERPMKISVIGAAGYVGSNVAIELALGGLADEIILIDPYKRSFEIRGTFYSALTLLA